MTCRHLNVFIQATPGSYWKCPDCGERFYLHPWDRNKNGGFADLTPMDGGPDADTHTAGQPSPDQETR